MAIGLDSLPLLNVSPAETPEEKAARLDGNVKRLIGLAAAGSVKRSLESEDAAVDADYKQQARGLAALSGDTATSEEPTEADMGNTVAGDHYENVTINMPGATAPAAQVVAQTAAAIPAATATLPAWAKTLITVGGISVAGLTGYALKDSAPAPKFTDTDTNTGVKVEGGIPADQVKAPQ